MLNITTILLHLFRGIETFVLSSFDNTNVLSVRCKKILRCDFKLYIAEIFAAREEIPEHFHKSNNRTIFK